MQFVIKKKLQKLYKMKLKIIYLWKKFNIILLFIEIYLYKCEGDFNFLTNVSSLLSYNFHVT